MTSPIVSIKDLNHFYGRDGVRHHVLKSVTMEIFPGEIVLLVGPSGSGKTTLVSLIGALRTVQEGSLKVFGQELCQVDRNKLLQTRRNTGYIFQHHNLLKFLSATQNVEMSLQLHEGISKKERRAMSVEMLKAVGLADRLDYFPDELSGGQKQRVAIARALVSRPKLIIADEPTSSLDSKSGLEVMELLHSLASQSLTAIILVTHDYRITENADRVLCMADGCIKSPCHEFSMISP